MHQFLDHRRRRRAPHNRNEKEVFRHCQHGLGRVHLLHKGPQRLWVGGPRRTRARDHVFDRQTTIVEHKLAPVLASEQPREGDPHHHPPRAGDDQVVDREEHHRGNQEIAQTHGS